MNLKILTILSLSFFLISCNTKNNENNSIKNTAEINSTKTENSEGYILLKSNCYACHSVTSKSHDEIIAPPMAAVKRRYKISYSSKEEFMEAIANWALNPTKENALMRGAVMQFNVMPKQPFHKENVMKIAKYIYDNELEKPEWLEKKFVQEHPGGKGKRMGRGRMMRN
jgi:cytochrome c2